MLSESLNACLKPRKVFHTAMCWFFANNHDVWALLLLVAATSLLHTSYNSALLNLAIKKFVRSLYMLYSLLFGVL